MATQDEINKDFKVLLESCSNHYYSQFSNYIQSKHTGYHTEADIFLLIMKLIVGLSSVMFGSLNAYLPDKKMDMDFIRVKILNEMSDLFKKSGEFIVEKNLIKD